MKSKSVISLSFLICCFLSACDLIPKNKNVIAAKFSEIDTGVKYIIIEKDTATHLPPKIDSSLLVQKVDSVIKPIVKDSVVTATPKPVIVAEPVKINIKTQQLVNFARTLVGKPYKYGGKDPAVGFDNSGFINYVFNHFQIEVPKYTAGFIVTGEAINIQEAAEGDLILFSKTDSVKKVVNHVGMIVSAKGSPISFIHATSGKVSGVTVTALNSYYQKKLMGIRRIIM